MTENILAVEGNVEVEKVGQGSHQAKVFFVSGIDTDIGKSIATGYYAKKLMAQGYSVITQKMVQTGSQGISPDIMLHRKIQQVPLYEEDKQGLTCTYSFDYPCSPHLAAKLAQCPIEIKKIENHTALLAEKFDYVLIEGAGGLAVPYDDEQTILDYLKATKYPLILVTSGRLGSINHSLLSLLACQQYGIPVHSVIYNAYPTTDVIIEAETKRFLQQYLARHFPQATFEELPQLDLA